MRDSNYRSITANRAAVTISTTLYDRRALDCTSDKPLVNSLNHLTFLTSSSGKVRETLSNDGGLERLVDILYECKLDENNRNLDENPLVAWKWSLAFQCLVFVGTRGTETIRKKLVDAGMIPVIATILDNYLAIHGNNDVSVGFGRQFAFGSHNNNNNNYQDNSQSPTLNTFPQPPRSRDDEDSDGNDSSSIVNNNNNNNTISSVLREGGETTNTETVTQTPTSTSNTSVPNVVSSSVASTEEILKGMSQCKKKTKQLHFWPDHIEQLKEKIDLMNNIVHLTSNDGYISGTNSDDDEFTCNKLLIDYIEEKNFSLDANKGKYAKFKKNRRQLVDLTAPRNFINGILVPIEDDILFSLQLLAFISKYSYLKPVLSETNIINGMSLRSPPQEDLLSFNGNFSNSVPALENDDNDNDNELEEVRSVDNDKKDDCDEIMIDTESANNTSNQQNAVTETVSNNDTLLGNKLDFILPIDMEMNVIKLKPMISNQVSVVCAELSNFDKLNMAVINLESNDDRLAKAKEFIKLTKVLNKDLKHESLKFKDFKIRHKILESNLVKAKWNYSTYPSFNNLEEDEDLNIKPSRFLNIFPLVEKFTVKSSNSKQIHYWAGVIMRNSCRRDDSKGGVRQCACFECSKWEVYPRQFAKCRRCKRTKYCSKECQATLWEYHRHWCVQTSSSSSSTAPSVPSTSAAAMTTTNNMIESPQQQQQQQQRSFISNGLQQDDNDSINSSLNTTTTAALLRQQQQQQLPLMSNTLGPFISPALLTLNNNVQQQQQQPLLSGAIASNGVNNNSTPVLGPNTNNRTHNFGTILFHNAVHATLAATTNNNDGSSSNVINANNNNNNNNNIGDGVNNGNNRGRFFFGDLSIAGSNAGGNTENFGGNIMNNNILNDNDDNNNNINRDDNVENGFNNANIMNNNNNNINQ